MKIKIKTDSHTHKDEPVPVGTVLDVDDATGKHLIEIGAADPVKKES